MCPEREYATAIARPITHAGACTALAQGTLGACLALQRNSVQQHHRHPTAAAAAGATNNCSCALCSVKVHSMFSVVHKLPQAR